MSDLNVTTISNSNIAKTDKLLAFNNNDSKAASIQDVVQLVPGKMAVATCSTAGNVATKAVTCADWTNKPGLSILVEFSNENSANNISLSINNGTAIPVYYMNTATEQVSGAAIPAGAVVFTLNAAGNKFYAHVTKYSAGAGIQINGNKIEAVNDLPTDAVLHYSFDEVPDYPDGTADYLRNNNFTSADASAWTGGNNVCSIEGGKLVVSNIQTSYFRMSIGTITNPIIKIKLRLSVDGNVSVYSYLSSTSSSSTLITTSVNANEIKEIVFACGSIYNVFGFANLPIGAKIEIFSVYIGNGSYSTPVIDNANGQNNATNNGGIATKGVSGKGAYFLNGKYTETGNFNLSQNFTVSVWVNPDNNTTGQTGVVINKANQFLIQNGSVTFDFLLLDLTGINGKLINAQNIGAKLIPNTWTHLVVTRVGTTLKVYRNSVCTHTFTLADDTISQNTNSLTVSYNGSTRPQSYDDLLIFDRALTEKEVIALYNNKANTPKYFSKADYLLEQIANNS